MASISMPGDLISKLEADIKAYQNTGADKGQGSDLIPKWNELLRDEPGKFINDDLSINIPSLENFRRLQIFIPDNPLRSIRKFSLMNLFLGSRRGELRMLRECVELLEEYGYDGLLRKYPCHPSGNPHVFTHKGLRLTFRWFKHIYSLGLLNQVLGSRLDGEFTTIDVGSSYGIFSSLVKQEYPSSHHVLVDFPEQLILAHYFLASCLPEARIAGTAVVSGQSTLSREFINEYDFVLVPSSRYEQILPGSADLVTNFASFGEMTREWFEYYLTAPAFVTAKYMFIMNRIKSYPTYDTDLTILDYPVFDRAKKLHFGVAPPFSNIYTYPRRNILFNQRVSSPPYFEYVGEI